MTVQVTISLTDPTPPQASALAVLLGGTAPAPSAGGTTTDPVPTPPPAAVEFFPADIGLTPSPSPEGSSLSVVSGKLYLSNSASNVKFQRDNAVLMDKMGQAFTIDASRPGRTAGCFPVMCNGIPYGTSNPELKPGASADQAQIVAGVFWWHESGKWFFLTNTSGGGGNLVTLPAYQPEIGKQYAAPTASNPGSLPGMPALPAPVSPAPGSTTAVTQATGTLAAALASASAGGTVALTPGTTYKESVGITLPLKITGGGSVANPGTATAAFSGGAKIDVTGVALFQGKGAVVPMTDVILDGIEITGAGLNEASAGGTGGVRNGNVSNMVVRDCYIHDNQDGIGPSVTSTLLMENCVLINNGLGGGQTHNIYTQAITATFNNVTSIVPQESASPLRTVTGKMNGGHALKSRANVTTINGGYYYSADASSLDIPDGSTQVCVITGATIEKKAGDGNHTILGYAVESMNNGVAGVKFVGCHFILNCISPQFISANGGALTFENCTWEGAKPVAVGFSSVIGLPV